MKKLLTLRQHEELGWKLKIIRDQLGEVAALIDQAYSRKRHSDRATLAQIEVDRLRTFLDTCVETEYCRELRLVGKLPCSVYYPEVNQRKIMEIGPQLELPIQSE